MAITKADLEARVEELEALLAKALEKVDIPNFPEKDEIVRELAEGYDLATKELEARIAQLGEALDAVKGETSEALDLLREYAGDLDLGREARDFGGRVRGFLDRF